MLIVNLHIDIYMLLIQSPFDSNANAVALPFDSNAVALLDICKKRATIILWNQIFVDKIGDNYRDTSKNGVDRLQNESIGDLNCYDDDKT